MAACALAHVADGEAGPVSPAAANEGKAVRTDRYGDPLPEGAVARLGTARLRQADSDRITTVAFSPDGKLLATAGGVFHWGGPVFERPYRVRLWDPATGKEVRRFGGYEIAIAALAFSPDGQSLAVAGDATVLYDVATGKRLRKFGGAARSLAFSPDGKLLAAGVARNAIRVWQVATGRVVREFRAGREPAYRLSFTRGGHQLVSVAGDRTARFWDFASDKPLSSIGLGYDECVALARDGAVWATAAGERSIKRWDVARRKAKPRIGWNRQGDSIHCLTVTTDGKLLALADDHDEIDLLDAATGRVRCHFRIDIGFVTTLGFSPDGTALAVGVCLTESGQRFALSGWAQVRLFDTATGRERLLFPAHRHVVEAVAFSPDGLKVASASWDGTLRLWDAESGRHRRVLARIRGGARELLFSPDGKVLAVVDMRGTLRLLDLATGKEQSPGARRPAGLLCIGFSPAGHVLALGRLEGATRLWDVSADREVCRLADRGPLPEATAAALSTDGKVLALAAQGPRVELWQTATGRRLGQIPAAARKGEGDEDRRAIPVDRIGFSPDGRLLAAAGSYGAMYLWDVALGRELPRFAQQRGHLMGFGGSTFAFSPDSRTLASAGLSRPVELWDVATGELIRAFDSGLETLRHQARGLTFSPDGRTLATGVDGDFTVMVWDVARVLDRGAVLPPAEQGGVLESTWIDLGTTPGSRYARWRHAS
jgi:WD40 repeat protein